MAILKVTDRDGAQHELSVASGTVMEALRDAELGVAALCGGMCACATCHVYVDPAWAAKLPDIQSDEEDKLCELAERQAQSRLSCQIAVRPEYDGLTVTIAPEEY